MEERILRQIADIVGTDNLSADETDRICYSYDATQQEYKPEVVVFPQNAQQVSLLLKLANVENVPVLPRGAGSGFTGGSLPVKGGMVLVLTAMNRILEIDEENMVAFVEPGVVTAELQKEVEKCGLFYPPDPASLKVSTLGGNAAECAGGPRCVKYGVTKDFIMGLEVVTPQGDIIKTGGQTMKGVVGYDLTKLIVGSEGTLGIITQLTIKLLPLPEGKKTMLVLFDSIDGAAQAVSTIVGGRIIPTTLEFMDARTIECVRHARPDVDLPEGAQAVLIIEVDGDSQLIERQIQRIRELIQPLGVVFVQVAQTPEESENLWQVRRAVSPSLREVNPDKFNEDICVPRSRVPDMIRRVDAIAREHEVPIVNFGHAGDGNIHVNIMVDRRDEQQMAQAEKAIEDVFKATLEMGGTMSGEHGVGITKAPYIPMELDPAAVAYMQTIKRALDPKNILNPDKLLYSHDAAGTEGA